jgi:hypothetical protein
MIWEIFMKRIIFIVTAIFIFAFSGNAQTCNLTAKDVPLRNIRLNMTMAEIEKQYELLSKKDTDEGIKIAVIRFTDAYYYLRFMSGKLHSIYVNYEKRFDSTKVFSEIISESLKLPNTWKVDGDFYEMSCKDFTIEIYTLKDSTRLTVTRILPNEPFKP